MLEVSSKGIEFLNMKRKLYYIWTRKIKDRRIKNTPSMVGLGVEGFSVTKENKQPRNMVIIQKL